MKKVTLVLMISGVLASSYGFAADMTKPTATQTQSNLQTDKTNVLNNVSTNNEVTSTGTGSVALYNNDGTLANRDNTISNLQNSTMGTISVYNTPSQDTDLHNQIQALANNTNAAIAYLSARTRSASMIDLQNVHYEGQGCSPTGSIGRDASGKILSCQSGIWQDTSSNTGSYVCIGSAVWDHQDWGAVSCTAPSSGYYQGISFYHGAAMASPKVWVNKGQLMTARGTYNGSVCGQSFWINGSQVLGSWGDNGCHNSLSNFAIIHATP